MKYIAIIFALVSMLGLSSSNAYARVFIGGGVIVGQPYYAYPPYYGYPYYAYPPAPPVAYAPAYATPYAPPPASPYDQYYTAPNGQYCREYQRQIMVSGQPQQAYGHACREQDGSWRIVD